MNAQTDAGNKTKTALIKGHLYFDTRSQGWFVYDEFRVFEFGGASRKLVMAASLANAEGSGRITVPNSDTMRFFAPVTRDYAHARLQKAIEALQETTRGKKLTRADAIKDVTKKIRPDHYCQDPVVLAKALVKIAGYIDSNRGENGEIGLRFTEMFDAFDHMAYTLAHFMRLTYGAPVVHTYNDLIKVFLTPDKRVSRAERIAEYFTYGEEHIILGKASGAVGTLPARDAREETPGVDIRDFGNFRLRFLKSDERYTVHILGKEGRVGKLQDRPYQVLEFLLKEENRGREITRKIAREKLGMAPSIFSQASLRLETAFKDAFATQAYTIFQISVQKNLLLAKPGEKLPQPELPSGKKLPRVHASSPKAVKRRAAARIKTPAPVRPAPPAPKTISSIIVYFGEFKLRVNESATKHPASLMDDRRPDWSLTKRAYNLLTLMDREDNRGKPVSPSMYAREFGTSTVTAYFAAKELKEAFAGQYPAKAHRIFETVRRGGMTLLVHSARSAPATPETSFARASQAEIHDEAALLRPAPGLKDIFKIAADILDRVELLSPSNMFMRDKQHQVPEATLLQKLDNIDHATLLKKAVCGQGKLAMKLTKMFMTLTTEAKEQARQVRENWSSELRRHFTI